MKNQKVRKAIIPAAGLGTRFLPATKALAKEMLPLTILSSISFIGSLIAPLLIGAISQEFDIRIAYMLIGILGGCIVLIVSFSSAFDIQESGDIPE